MCIEKIRNLSGEVLLTYDLGEMDFGSYDLTGAYLEQADLERKVWQEVILRRVNLRQSEIYSGTFFLSDFKQADCEGIRFWGTDLKKVDFTKANLKNAVFGKNNLGGATNICGANFTDAILDGAKFDETRYDRKTIFPKNFNPAKHGLIRIESK